MGSTESGPQLKPLLECFPILLIGHIFNGDGVVTLTGFAVFLHSALALLCNVFKSGTGGWVGDILGDVILQNTTWVRATTPDQ
jgi:hypothetical protein